jgi:hypothetical protein
MNSENLKERNQLCVPGTDGRTVLKWIWKCGLNSPGSGERPEVTNCEHTNEPLAKRQEFIDHLSDY